MESIKGKALDLSTDEVTRYSRHLSLPEIGLKGQKKLKNSSVLCIGCGGLGSSLLIYLAAAGVGKLGIVDNDLVEESNLQRQIIHKTKSIGKPKTVSAYSTILDINPHCNVELFSDVLSEENALEIINSFDIVCDCTDNFPSRYLINDACVILGKPNIYGSVSKFEGQASVFNLEKNSPNFRDLIPEPPPMDLIPSCSATGVVGVLPGIIGIIQATEVIKVITGIGDTLSGRLLVFNALKMTFRELNLIKNKDLNPIVKLIDYKKFCLSNNCLNSTESTSSIPKISAQELRKILKSKPNNIIIIDVRTPLENKELSIKGATLIPFMDIASGKEIENIKAMSLSKKIYIHCKTGERSLKALLILKENGVNGINIDGGIQAWLKTK